MNKLLIRAALLLTLAGAAPAALLTSCSQADRQEASADADRAYNDFRSTVERAEARVQNVDLDDAAFKREMDEIRTDYDNRVAVVERDIDRYPEDRRAEIERLKTRYTSAVEQRQTAYSARTQSGGMADMGPVTGGKYYKPVGEYSSVTAANMRSTFENFNRMVKQNEDQYDVADWRAVNADWKALNARYDQIDDQISAADKREIAKEQVKYTSFKVFDKAEARTSEGARAVGEAANKAGRAIDRTANKVGAAAKGAYKGARDAIRDNDAETHNN